MKTDERRVKNHKITDHTDGNVVYWMSRDQRIDDNWALYYAYELAQERGTDLSILFYLKEDFLQTAERNLNFMMEGIVKTWDRSWKLGIPFNVQSGELSEVFQEYVSGTKSDTVITDFSPFHIKNQWIYELKKLDINVIEVDAHNLIPARVASDIQEESFLQFKTKIIDRVEEFSKLPPKIKPSSKPIPRPMVMITSQPHGLPYNSGEDEALKTLKTFIKEKLKNYALNKDDPNTEVSSNLSPYIHFGQIYIGRVIKQLPEKHDKNFKAFLDEILVRRELSDNFCFYNKDYDSFKGIPEWGKETLTKHREDEREFIYTDEELENAITHDDAWNAAQEEMLMTGKMHGYMRKYWAKKILEWRETPEDAIKVAIYLNDKYSVDGGDPNGYTGILWAIGGLHDRKFKERDIFGKVRYLDEAGLKKKFNLNEYIQRVKEISI